MENKTQEGKSDSRRFCQIGWWGKASLRRGHLSRGLDEGAGRVEVGGRASKVEQAADAKAMR